MLHDEERRELPYHHVSPKAEAAVDENHFSPLLIKSKSKQQLQPTHNNDECKRSGNSIHSSSISLSPNCIQMHESNIIQSESLNITNNIQSPKSPHSQLHEFITNDIDDVDSSIKKRNSDPLVYYALKQSLNYFIENVSDSWKSKWSLKFDEIGLEHYFKIYFAHRYLLSNQAAFLMFALFYIIILFIFDVESKYEWISVIVHCILIIIIFIALILSLTDQFNIYIHRLTAMVLFIILIGLDIQAVLAEIPISAQSILTQTLILLGSCSFLSIRYHHIIVLFGLFIVITNITFISVVLKWHNRIQNTKFTLFLWFNMLLLFAMMCTAHLVRLFEMQERKLFLRVLHQMKETRKSLQRQLTVYETVSIAQLIDNDRTGHDNDVLDRVLQQFIVMDGLFQHLPEIDENQEDQDQDKESQCEIATEIQNNENILMNCIPSNNNINGSHRPQICKSSELPDFYNEYPFIPIGYRIDYGYKEAIYSILQWHNETVNMWTEIVPLVLNAFCLSYFVSNDSSWAHFGFDDKCIFLISAVLILILRPFCSLLAHTFYLISKKAHDFWWRVDYISICVTMLCEGVVSGNYVFSCNNQLKILFFTFVICMFISTMLSTMVSHTMQIRAASFCLFVSFATGCPFLYQWVSFAQSHDTLIFKYLILWTISYILAAIALIIKSLWFPERCCKRKRHCLSYVGASHQIWHVLINSCLSLSVYSWIVYLRFKYGGNFTC